MAGSTVDAVPVVAPEMPLKVLPVTIQLAQPWASIAEVGIPAGLLNVQFSILPLSAPAWMTIARLPALTKRTAVTETPSAEIVITGLPAARALASSEAAVPVEGPWSETLLAVIAGRPELSA